MAQPIAVAITGGIGAGKSEALAAFARHGAATISSDEIVHRLLRDDEEVQAALRERWGAGVVGPDGADRAAIAAIVFERPDELAWLEGLLHPKVVQEYLAWREQQTAPVAVTEVPLPTLLAGERKAHSACSSRSGAHALPRPEHAPGGCGSRADTLPRSRGVPSLRDRFLSPMNNFAPDEKPRRAN